jgi:quinol monooxygenase YgiN
MAAVACPRSLCTTLTLAPALIANDAAVCRSPCGYEVSDPYSIATFVERSAVFLDGQVPTAMAWKQECVRIAANEPDTIIYASHTQADEPNLRVSYECYRNHDALRAHEATPHTRRFLAERTQHLASPPEVWTLAPSCRCDQRDTPSRRRCLALT